MAGITLDSLYDEGVDSMRKGRFGEAEKSFRCVLLVDSNDWDARECLALLYQWEGRAAERDRELGFLRRMLFRDAAWRRYIRRDEFIMKGWRILAVETPVNPQARRRKYLFAVSDNATGRFLHMIAMTRRAVVESDSSAMDGAALYEVEVQCGNRRKVYRLGEAEPRYADSVRLLERFLEGI